MTLYVTIYNYFLDDLKLKIEENFGIPHENIRLLLNGKQLKKYTTVNYFIIFLARK